MKIIKYGKSLDNVKDVLADHHVSWSAKGIYAQLMTLPNYGHLDLIEFSTRATDGLSSLKRGLNELKKDGYLIINNKLLIIKLLNKKARALSNVNQTNDVVIRSKKRVSYEFLRNQWQIVWHRDDARVTKALSKLADYLNPAMVLYGIQYSKQHCHSYRESLPYLNRLIMKWKKHHLTTVEQTQHWLNQRKLKSKPWNSEIQSRIFGARQRTTINNTPIRKGIPDVFKKHRK